MGFFSDIDIDQSDRMESGRVEWALILTDEKRPATVWRVIGRARGFTYLEHGRFPVRITVPDSDAWIIA